MRAGEAERLKLLAEYKTPTNFSAKDDYNLITL